MIKGIDYRLPQKLIRSSKLITRFPVTVLFDKLVFIKYHLENAIRIEVIAMFIIISISLKFVYLEYYQ